MGSLFGLTGPIPTAQQPLMPAYPQTMQQMSSGNPTAKSKPPIYKPLDSMADILYDAEAEQMIEDDPNLSSDELAMRIWIAYGGREDGNVIPGRIGERIEQDMYNVQEAEKERKITEHSRWKRLPKGKYIIDLFKLDELAKVIKGLIYGHIKETKQQAPAGGMGGGMSMPIASGLSKWVKLSYIADCIRPSLGEEFDKSLTKTAR